MRIILRVLRKTAAVAAAASIAVLSGCLIEDDGTQAVSVSGGSSEVTAVPNAATPVPLPFDNPFPNRWNESNDGSSFEPCVAFSEEELLRFDVDPSVIQDAAVVDGQGIRGCKWSMKDRFYFSNLVTNSSSLEVYRLGVSEYNWYPDIEIQGRTVGLFSLKEANSFECATYVQSFNAAVITSVVTSTSGDGQAIDACKIVQDFTRAYIDKIPG